MSREFSNSTKFGWTDPKEEWLHDYINPTILKVLKKLPVKKILDLGCGRGTLVHGLKNIGYETVGCDIDQEGIEIARKGSGTFFILGVYDDPAPLGPEPFDCVISSEVIEHLYSPEHLPKFADKVLKTGGYLIITAPYHGFIKNLLISLFNMWDSHLDPVWEGGHIKFWSRPSLTSFLELRGFNVLKFYGVGRISFLWKSMIFLCQKK